MTSHHWLQTLLSVLRVPSSWAGVSAPALPALVPEEWQVSAGPHDWLSVWNSERHDGRRPVPEHLGALPGRRGVGDKGEEQVSGSIEINTLICQGGRDRSSVSDDTAFLPSSHKSGPKSACGERNALPFHVEGQQDTPSSQRSHRVTRNCLWSVYQASPLLGVGSLSLDLGPRVLVVGCWPFCWAAQHPSHLRVGPVASITSCLCTWLRMLSVVLPLIVLGSFLHPLNFSAVMDFCHNTQSCPVKPIELHRFNRRNEPSLIRCYFVYYALCWHWGYKTGSLPSGCLPSSGDVRPWKLTLILLINSVNRDQRREWLP